MRVWLEAGGSDGARDSSQERKQSRAGERKDHSVMSEMMTPPQGEHLASTSGLFKQLVKATVKREPHLARKERVRHRVS